MTNIHEAASTVGVSWRALQRLADHEQRAMTADAIFTATEQRTPVQRGIIATAQELSEIHAKTQRRMSNANLAHGRVNGGYLRGGQPRGKQRKNG